MKKFSLFELHADAGAEFDEPERMYRFRLWRTWGTGGRIVVWIMLNPSTADEHVLDQTLRKVETFSRMWGFDGFVVVNVFSLRSTDPSALYNEPGFNAEWAADYNYRTIGQQARDAAAVVVGWGTEEIAQEKAKTIAFILKELGIRAKCLGINKDGSPKHPLYLPYTTALIDWPVAA